MKSGIVCGIAFLFIVFIGCFDYWVPFLNYWDEIFVVGVISCYIIKMVKKKISMSDFGSNNILLIELIVILGLFGNVIHAGIQNNLSAIIKDIFAFLKFPLTISLLNDIGDNKRIDLKVVYKLARIITVATAVIAVCGYVFDIGVYIDDPTRPLKTFQFFYQHCTFFVFSYVIVAAVLIAESVKKNRLYILFLCGLLFMTQRTKAYFIVFILLCVLVIKEEWVNRFINPKENEKKLNRRVFFLICCLVILIGIVIGKNRFTYYWQYGMSSARTALYIVGVELMFSYFPFGSGFGTFASFISGRYYSNIYYEYGLAGVLGLGPDAYNYASDVFWPYIYGQFGVIGLISYVVVIVRIFYRQLKNISDCNVLLAILVIWAYALFASSAEAFFTNTTAIQMIIIFHMLFGNYRISLRN